MRRDPVGVPVIAAEEAFRRCEEITWAEARNFAYGIRLLPPPKRKAMAALYAMARRIDDVGDAASDDWPDGRKLGALEEMHGHIDALEEGCVPDPADPVLVGVACAARLFPIPVAALHEIVAGCELDVRGETYETMDDTVRYCRLVAGSVGRLSLGVFGSTGPGRARSSEELADDLGVALQLTNMLRDIAEDLRMGRIYLPERDRCRFGIAPGLWEPAESVGGLVEFVGGQASAWFDRGLPLLERLDHRSRACTAAMAGIYRRLLSRILARPTSPLAGRISLPAWEKALVALRGVAGLRV